MSSQPPSPQKIMEHSFLAHVSAAVVATATAYAVFTQIDRGAETVEAIAQQTGLSLRGTQALLDGLTGIGLLSRHDGRYANAEEARWYLVEGKPTYLGAFAKMILSPFGEAFHQLPQAAKTGMPVAEATADAPDNPFWEELVLSIVPLATPLAERVAQRTGFGGVRDAAMLDVGGGSGIYSAVLLQANPRATATQVDWPRVNRVARGFVGKSGVGDRFRAVDGDFHVVEFGEAAYDLVIYSNIAHQESPADNRAVFRRLRRALKPSGTLVVSDFVLGDDRGGNAWTSLFHTVMLVQTKAGAVWREAEYRTWLTEAGFRTISVEPTALPSTLIFAS